MKRYPMMLAIALTSAAPLGSALGADVVYDNTSDLVGVNHGAGTDECGDDIELLENGPRAITQLDLGLLAGVNVSVDLVVRIYDNQGGTPGTPVWTSPVQTVSGSNASGRQTFTVFVPSVVVSDTMTWTMQRVDGGLLTLLRYDPPSVGGSDDFFWQKSSSNAWSTGTSGVDDNFYARVYAEPANLDSDGDGLLDSVELDIAEGTGCPDPQNPDSDGDSLSDGEEVMVKGTNPCDVDTDADGLTDDVDLFPTDPGSNESIVARMIRDVADNEDPEKIDVAGLDLNIFTGPNSNANKGRRNALQNKLTAAANAVAEGGFGAAISILEGVLERMDGVSPAPDWLDPSGEGVGSIVLDIEELLDILDLLSM